MRAAGVPFGHGVRHCIGFVLARMERTLIVARLAQRLVLVRPRPPCPAPTAWQSTSRQAASRFASDREHCPMSNPFPPPDPARVARPAPAPRDDSVLAAFGASGVIAAAAGAAAGLVWGGIGGRIAMRVVFLTSNEHVRGVTSDDGFEIGTFSGATMFLLIFTTILGGMAGFGVGIIRMVTSGPTWAVAIGTSLAAASFVGAGIVHTDGVDFRLLDPLWLTVGLFVLIPGLWGATVVVVTERLLRSHLHQGLPLLVHRRYWGATGWILLVGITTIGIQGLVADIATLT